MRVAGDPRPSPTAAMILPPEAHGLVQVLAFHFTSPTYQRASTLLVGVILTTGRRTVANVLRAPRSGLALGRALARFRLDHVVPDGVVTRVGDDTVDGHPGPNVYGKARHRDPVRSSHSYTAWRYGHTWVVLAVLVPVPVAKRRWALPILIDLYRSAEDDRARKRRHRTRRGSRAGCCACSSSDSRVAPSYSSRIPGTEPTRWPGSMTVIAPGGPRSARCTRTPTCSTRPRRIRVKGDHGSRARVGPSPARPLPPPQPSPGWKSGGTAGASGASRPLRALGTGTRAGADGSRCAGCSSGPRPAHTATSTCSPPTRPSGPMRWSAPTVVAGASKPHSRKPGPLSGWRPRAAGGEANGSARVAGQGHGHVLRRPVRRPPVVVGRGPFATGRGRRGPSETPGPIRELLLTTLAPAA
ncbi:transposase family protein : Uncharacterized protein OS=Singulisphaera acidiphila (strain ATCC BAA-1392 / DSM 18658 / VKM B-2454 / MOB10) GN=Sinac_4890 PE=4 SV=1 [Gemmata massiliana]|uniref:Transposase family protein: Uncharacterized protein n=1 Tax=Gemmata massiliana TaxID=1210884 RepID=A0A6P2D9D7_9BACT|nr:transposase family protein : Uncharacterized protein OS=Singulisphaera acidiphila (strain ATCC BAA-1392 / DSM 18658 / VKM B-2454 / MOB10) GN=Sinac_4890 PE=4 SV=1 [Gemmata massiliana]